jgi:hypothetical protein
MTDDPRFQQSYGAEDGSILPWTTQSRLVKGASGGALAEEEEVLVGDTSKKVPPHTTIAELAGAYRRWGNTLIVANASLDKPVLNPVHVLAYIDMLGYLASYPNMLYPQYASYVNESRLRLIVDVDERGLDIDSVLIRVRRTLWEDDLPNFRKFVHLLPALSSPAAPGRVKGTTVVSPTTAGVTAQTGV